VSRQAVPDPAAALTAVAGRVAGIEQDLGEIRQDVAALGRGVADLLAQVRHLTPQHGTGPTTVPGGPADPGPAGPNAAGGEDEEEEEEVQRDWLTVTDPDTAAAWLADVAEWAQVVLARHGVELDAVPCWPLHPAVVVDLLALSAQRESAYPQPGPTPVMEWLTRWLPPGIGRITTGLTACRKDHGHWHAGDLYDASGLTSPEGLAGAGRWWATARDTSPGPAWLHLPAAA
jgi:hypothetical protein